MHNIKNTKSYFNEKSDLRKSGLRKYQAHLFDLDGTLVVSEELKGKALAIACSKYREYEEDGKNGKDREHCEHKQHGQELDFNIYKPVMGESWAVVTDHFFSIADISPERAAFDKTFHSIYKKLLHEQAKLTAYAKNYLLSLKQDGCQLGVVSSAATWMVEQLLEQLCIASLFDVVITGDDVTKHKPDPEAYQLALSKISMACKDVLVYEDSWAGLIAAKGAGCDVIAVQHDFNVENDLSLAMCMITDFSVESIRQITI